MPKPLMLAFAISLRAFAVTGGSDVSDTDALAKSVVALQMIEVEPAGKINRYKGSAAIVADDSIRRMRLPEDLRTSNRL